MRAEDGSMSVLLIGANVLYKAVLLALPLLKGFTLTAIVRLKGAQ